MESADKRYVSRLTRDTLALILAGGRGDRLQGLTRWRAKPAVPFGGKFRIIDFPLSNCVNSGVRRIAVLTQYKAHSLLRHLYRGWGFLRSELGEFMEILPASQRVDNEWYAGTADAVYQNLDILRDHDPSFVLVLAGDHIYKMDYGLMIAYHDESGADMTIGCIEVPVADARSFGVMTIDDEFRVKKFDEKPEHPQCMPGRDGYALASMGIYVFNTQFLYEQLIKDRDTPRSSHDFGKDIIPSVIGRYRVLAYPFRGTGGDAPAYWRDVGTVDAYYRANMELLGVTPALNLYDRDWPIWTYQEQTPPAKFVFDDDGRRGHAVDSMVSGGCIVAGARLARSLLFSNVHVELESELEDCVVLPDVSIGPGCKIRHAVIDKGCVIPPHTIIGQDPARDKERFFVSPGGVILVTPETLGQEHHLLR
ncbi:MAG: glucose-1-phosphate adenylyltransferase [Gammaproteobacteria bacterium]|nr:glucose-1-phosphate adenylyltransferase [Gammaproteobacteria bacterium]MBI5616857.1 glucose-1-phosphate adenylyltransferase [Gammaproteobacteria bacterium]